MARGSTERLSKPREIKSGQPRSIFTNALPSLRRAGKLLVFTRSTDRLSDCSSGECRLKTAIIIDRRRLVVLAATFALAPAVNRPTFAQAWPTHRSPAP